MFYVDCVVEGVSKRIDTAFTKISSALYDSRSPLGIYLE
jgi:hypothetical protein